MSPGRRRQVVAGCGAKVEVLAVRTGQFYGQHMVACRIYVIAAGTASAGLAADGVAVDHAGNVIIANPSTNTFPVSGVVQAIAARTGTFYGVSMTAGHLYTIAAAGARAGWVTAGPRSRAGSTSPPGSRSRRQEPSSCWTSTGSRSCGRSAGR